MHPGTIGLDGGPLMVAYGDGTVRFFVDRPSLPAVNLVIPAEQAVAALSLFPKHGARFEASDSNLPVLFTIDDVMTLGWSCV